MGIVSDRDIKELGGTVVSVLTAQESDDAPARKVSIRLRPLPAEREDALAASMQAAFPSMLCGWSPVCVVLVSDCTNNAQIFAG